MVFPDDYFSKIWLNEAIETLSPYNANPFTDKFLEKYNLKFKGGEQFKHLMIKKEIADAGRPLSLKNLVDYTDEIKMYGKQHISLYVLKKKQKEYLEKLRDPNYIQERIGNYLNKKRYRTLEVEDLFNKSILIKNARKPRLAKVKHFYNKNNGEGQLLFKWIKTRSYVGTKRERSVNFFVVDLKNGTTEIRLQVLKTDKKMVLQDELNDLKNELKKVLTFNLFSSQPLEPIIKTLFAKPYLTVTKCRIEKPGEDKRDIPRNCSAFLGLKNDPYKTFFCHSMTLYWECKQRTNGNRKLYFTLNGANDEIKFNAITDKSKVDFLLEVFKGTKTDDIEMAELKELANSYPEYSRVIFGIDYHLSKLNNLKVDAKKLSSEIGVPEDFIKKVFKTAVEKFGKKFFIEGKKENILSTHNKIEIKSGLLGYAKRKMVDSQDKERKKKNLTKLFTTFFVATLPPMYIEQTSSWLKEEIFGIFFRDAPFIIFQILIPFIEALILFGCNLFLKKIPKVFRYILGALFSDAFNDRLKSKFDKKYNKWKQRKKSKKGPDNHEGNHDGQPSP